MNENLEISVLIVDDEKPVRSTLRAYLEDFSFIISDCGNAEDALSIASDTVFDISIIDLRLPVLNGEALILKLHELYPKMHFIIYTGMLRYTISKGLKNIGLTQENLFLKPQFDLSVFKDAIERLAGK